MAISDYNKTITVIDATTGDIITVIKCRLYNNCTIESMIGDIWLDDYISNQRGIFLKYGIEAN